MWCNSEDVWPGSIYGKFFLLDIFQLFLEYGLSRSSVARLTRALKWEIWENTEELPYLAVTGDTENQVNENTVKATGVFAGMVIQISIE